MNRLAAQQGAVLLFALVLLLIMTVLGLTSIRGVGLQQRMATNLYDRDLALQAAEAALSAAEAAIILNSDPVGMVDCSPTSIQSCEAVPANTFQNDNTGWVNIAPQYEVNAAANLGTPQYYIQLMGRGETGIAFGQYSSANSVQYGVNPGVFGEQYYRITARSSNPADVQDRALVVLQATVKRNM